jgi:hypothetical protein
MSHSLSTPDLARLILAGYTETTFTLTLPARVDTVYRDGAIQKVTVPAASVTVTVNLQELVGLARRAQGNKSLRARLGGHTAKAVR